MLIKKLEKSLIKHKLPVYVILNPSNIKLIEEITFIHDFSFTDIEYCLLQSINKNKRLDTNIFMGKCKDLLKLKNNLSESTSVLENSSSKKERFIQELENVTPKQLMQDLSSEGKVSKNDLNIVENVMRNYNLSSPVMNVLIHYVLLTADNKISKNYLEKIASHWSKANLTTVREALEFAKQENKKHKKSKQLHTEKSQLAEFKLKAIEQAMFLGISDEELGKFVRNTLQEK
jgi:replication initiation and membrane attachment protein